MILGTQILGRQRTLAEGQRPDAGPSLSEDRASGIGPNPGPSPATGGQQSTLAANRSPEEAGGSLYRIKPAFVASLDGVARHLVAADVSPDAITLAAVPVQLAAAAAIVAGAFWPIAWLIVAPLLLVLMSMNALDGVVARRTDTSSRGGAIRNELVDRAGDAVVLLAGFAVAPWPVVVAAVVAVAATEMAALVGWTATGVRTFPGLMGKPDRAATVGIGATVAVVWAPALPIAFLAVGVGAALGTITRTRQAFAVAAQLDERDAS
jgi:phosphatidylglycerophosphate synthase